jgi:four helix bundle protein
MNRAMMLERMTKFGTDILKFCRPLLQREDCRRPAAQLSDAGTSVAANYHAACRARSKAEFIAKLGIVNEESDEAVLWLTLLRDSGLVNSPELMRLLQEATELRAIVATSRATAIANENRRREEKAGRKSREVR